MILVYGGTFDPVHLGHTRLAEHVIHHLQPEEFRFMPCFKPVHKAEAQITAVQRVEMLSLAIAELAENYRHKIIIDEREVKSAQPKFSLDSLAEIRQEVGSEKSLVFVMGADSLLSLPSWHRWAELTHYCHLLVLSRPGFDVSSIPGPVLESFHWLAPENVSSLSSVPNGNGYFLSGLEQNISSSEIRDDIKANKNSISPAVFDYILRNHLYNKQP